MALLGEDIDSGLIRLYDKYPKANLCESFSLNMLWGPETMKIDFVKDTNMVMLSSLSD